MKSRMVDISHVFDQCGQSVALVDDLLQKVATLEAENVRLNRLIVYQQRKIEESTVRN